VANAALSAGCGASVAIPAVQPGYEIPMIPDPPVVPADVANQPLDRVVGVCHLVRPP
jgi:hypothetical protein